MSKPRKGAAENILANGKRRALDAVFTPQSVAVVGATERGNSVGAAVMRNLEGFPGKVYPINPKRKEIFGRRAFASLGEVKGAVDLAVVVTPATTVPGIIRQCAAAEVPAAIIISAGFKETGKAGEELERQTLAEARTANIRLVGPNCLGVMAPHHKFNATFAAGMANPGNVAFVSQSGALCTAILDWSFRENVGFSAFVSVGSMLDVSWGDLIYYLGDDPHTRSIVIYMESVGNARTFLSAAREVALNKPIIVIKVGRTAAAAKAASSHTGSLTGSDDVLDAAFSRVGVLRVNSIEELFDMAEVLGKQPRPKGNRLAIVTNAGGPGALATDALVGSGGRLAEISQSTHAALNEMLPPHWSHGNPIDVLGDADPECFSKAVDLAAKDEGTDGVLCILTPQEMTDAAGTAEKLKGLRDLNGKPLLASWMGGPAVEAGEEILNKANIPTFKYPDRAARAFEYMWRYSANLKALYETPALYHATDEDQAGKMGKVEKIIKTAREEKRKLLTELESKQILSAYGIPTVRTDLALNESQAIQLAEEIGYPVVLKLHSKTLTHKTDVGGVHLNLRNATGVKKAWQAMEHSVKTKAGEGHFLGVTVQPMVQLEGYELILGSSIDPQFGPVIMFGAGGQLVEVFKDRALGLPPLNATLAKRLIERTRISKALLGVRGRAAVDMAALEQLLARFSQLVAEQKWIEEMDINPLLVSSERLIALDARVVLHDSEIPEGALPRLAIRPYPLRYVSGFKLKKGATVTLRPIRPEDEPLLVNLHHSISEESVYFRYFTKLKLEQRIAHERLSRICFIDYDREMALVAEHRKEGGEAEIIGVGRLSKLHGINEAEFALLVADKWQGQGLGEELLRRLVHIGKAEKLDKITGAILPGNRAMQHVAKKAGFVISHEAGEAEVMAMASLARE